MKGEKIPNPRTSDDFRYCLRDRATQQRDSATLLILISIDRVIDAMDDNPQPLDSPRSGDPKIFGLFI